MSIRKQIDAAIARKDDLVGLIYSRAEHGHMPFAECMERADTETRCRYRDAAQRLFDLEHEAVKSGKAWRGAFGMLVWNR